MAISDFMVTIKAREDAPEDWPIQEMVLTITAQEADEAEDIADQCITAIQNSRGVNRALEIDSTYEEA